MLDEESTSDVDRAKSQVWLKQFVDSISKEGQEEAKPGKSSLNDNLLAMPERLAMLTYNDIAQVIQLACDEEQWEEQGFRNTLDNSNTDLLGRLKKQTLFIKNAKGLAPAFSSTLHSLYTAYDIGRMVLKFSNYLSQPSMSVHSTQVAANKKVVEGARQLIQAVADTCAAIKRELDEGGWIDKVLDSVLRSEHDIPIEQAGKSVSLVGTLQELVGENFMEEWAGQVVESWKDSIIGLSYLKAPSSA